LIEFARHQAKMARSYGDPKSGATYGDHLRAAARHSQVARAELAGPRVPMVFGYIWEWYVELREAQQHGPFGFQPISYAEIRAWAELTRSRPRPWEVRWIRRLDNVMRSPPPKEGEDGRDGTT